MTTQSRLRKSLRADRRKLSRRFQQAAAQTVRRVMNQSLRFRRARRVAFYCAAGGELDVWPLLHDAAAAGQTCYLPVMTDRLMGFRPSPMVFQRFDPMQSALVEGQFGMLEPALDPRQWIRPEMLDVILLPLVAYDSQGGRVGMGMGYYDRTLAGLTRAFRRPWLVGCGYSMQEVRAIPANAWDIRLDAVVTENGLQANRLRRHIHGNAETDDNKEY